MSEELRVYRWSIRSWDYELTPYDKDSGWWGFGIEKQEIPYIEVEYSLYLWRLELIISTPNPS